MSAEYLKARLDSAIEALSRPTLAFEVEEDRDGYKVTVKRHGRSASVYLSAHDRGVEHGAVYNYLSWAILKTEGGTT